MKPLSQNPLILLTLLAVIALLTRTSALLALSTSNRFTLAVDRAKSLSAHLDQNSALAGSVLLSAMFAAPSQGQAQLVDLSGTPKGVFEIVATFNGPAPSGVAVSKQGRIFLSFPRHAVDHSGPTLAELKGGQLIPFPNAALNLQSGGNPSQTLVSVHGITMDAQDRLWVIDDGKRAGKPIEPGAAKVVGFDVNTGELVRKVVLSPPALLPDSHMNDLRVDLTHGSSGMAYVADSSFGTSPALVVVELSTGKVQRRLAHHVSTQLEKGFMAVIEGRPMLYKQGLPPTFPTGGVDGVALSPNSSRLYYAPLTSRHLYSIPTAVLANFSASDSELAAAVVDEGEKGAADGLAVDQMGRLYTTNHELDAILRRQPNGRFEIFARDPRLLCLSWETAIRLKQLFLLSGAGLLARKVCWSFSSDNLIESWAIL